jgi:hypothetical protein
VEGVLLLDDIVGFLSLPDYREFAHPYLREIFQSFPEAVKLFHNDTNNPVSFGCYTELGVRVFNFTHLQPLDKVRELVGPEMCLMGNVPPLEVLAKGTPDSVRQSVAECRRAHRSTQGWLLSAGGGTSRAHLEGYSRKVAAARSPRCRDGAQKGVDHVEHRRSGHRGNRGQPHQSYLGSPVPGGRRPISDKAREKAAQHGLGRSCSGPRGC